MLQPANQSMFKTFKCLSFVEQETHFPETSVRNICVYEFLKCKSSCFLYHKKKEKEKCKMEHDVAVKFHGY